MKPYNQMNDEEKRAFDRERQEATERKSKRKKSAVAKFVEMDFSTRQQCIDAMTTVEIGALIGGAASWRSDAMWEAAIAARGDLDAICKSVNHANAEARGERRVKSSSHPEVSDATTEPVLELDKQYEAMHLFWLQAFVAWNYTSLLTEPGEQPTPDVIQAAETIATLIARETGRDREEILAELVKEKGDGISSDEYAAQKKRDELE